MSQKLPHPSAHAGRPKAPPANTPSDAAAEPPTDPVAPRIPAAQIPEITGLRLSPHGTDAKLINISTSGLLGECSSRLKVGSTVAVLFEGTFTESSVVGRIARCEVSTMGKDGVLRYHIGIDFNKPIALDRWTQPAEDVQAPAQTAAGDDTPPRPRPVPVPSPAAALAPAVVRNRW